MKGEKMEKNLERKHRKVDGNLAPVSDNIYSFQ